MDPNLIPVIAIISSFVFTLGIVVAGLYFGNQKRKLQHKEILAAIEKGMDIPLPRPKEKDYRTQGIVFTMTGVVLALALWASTGSIIGLLWGLIPLALGVAYLLIARGKQNQDEN